MEIETNRGRRRGRRRWGRRLVGTGSGVAIGAMALAGLGGPARVAGATVTGAVADVSTGAANLWTGDAATFDGGAGGWAGSNAGLSIVPTPVQAGTGALALTAASAGLVAAVSGTGPSSWTPAVPSRVYTTQVSVRAAATSRPAETALAFLSSSGSTLSTAWGQLTPDAVTGWTQTTPAVGVAPPGTAYVKAAVLFYGLAAGETHYIDSASLTARPSGSAPVAGPLHTVGNRIYDVNNRPVTLRGTVSDWLDWNATAPVGSPLDDSNVAEMKQWGDNVVRVLLSENYWDSTNCQYSPGYAGAVDRVVNSITSRGMVALLTLHNNGRTACDVSEEQRMADAPGSLTFWQQVATRYQSNPLVAFDLYNEPHDVSWDQWLNGGTLTDPDGLTWQATGMRQMFDTVRQTGAQNLIVVSGNWWAGSPPSGGYLLPGSNVVYAAHAYTCPNSTVAACTTPSPTAVPSSLTAWAPLAAVLPVMLTEFGWPNAGGSTYSQNVINWAESQSIGWTAYGWYKGGTYGANTIDFGILAGNPYEPVASGMPVLAGLAANS
jgi:endoglucanase